ncbi:MAG TPA: PKD domain-containing protein [Candidatus Saccharimonadales bacterium]|nr:PKD domain-containing protein [Candidatus Saccharimonadales bacterium]
MRKFYLSLAGLAIVLGAVLLLNVFNGQSNAALPRDCDSNAIIHCGAGDVNELTQKVNENKTGDLSTIYGAYGITSSMFASAKMGEVRKDGTVVVDGQVVATDAMSIGRQKLAGSTAKTIGGKTYYNSPPSTSFRSNSIVAFVFFDANGVFKSAIITSCGNPVEGKPKPKPAYKCDSLTPAAVTRTKYNFTASASASGGATVTNYTFDFGDGKTATGGNVASHEYAKAGAYTIKVTANISVNGTNKPATGTQCQTTITIAAPAYACDALTIRSIDLSARHYAYDLSYTAKNGAALQSVDYDFGDGKTQNGVSAEDAKTVEHTYEKAGSYKTTATLHFSVDGAVKDVKCEVSITTNPDMCPLNPTLPKDDARCTPCPVPGKEQYPKDSPLCVAPTVPELPKTGPMDLLFGGLGISSIVAAGYYWFASRRGLLQALLNR